MIHDWYTTRRQIQRQRNVLLFLFYFYNRRIELLLYLRRFLIFRNCLKWGGNLGGVGGGGGGIPECCRVCMRGNMGRVFFCFCCVFLTGSCSITKLKLWAASSLLLPPEKWRQWIFELTKKKYYTSLVLLRFSKGAKTCFRKKNNGQCVIEFIWYSFFNQECCIFNFLNSYSFAKYKYSCVKNCDISFDIIQGTKKIKFINHENITSLL